MKNKNQKCVFSFPQGAFFQMPEAYEMNRYRGGVKNLHSGGILTKKSLTSEIYSRYTQLISHALMDVSHLVPKESKQKLLQYIPGVAGKILDAIDWKCVELSLSEAIPIIDSVINVYTKELGEIVFFLNDISERGLYDTTEIDLFLLRIARFFDHLEYAEVMKFQGVESEVFHFIKDYMRHIMGKNVSTAEDIMHKFAMRVVG
ncbi:hypothetical protein HON22_03735 [Candidatus Peregrinibacteria bacterium]|nr:hypothetical protein [Candidatus Peregrinibacteria bacterium]